MGSVTFGRLRSAVLFFTVFFAISAAAQFLFVRAQTTGIIVQGLREDAADLNKAIAYKDGINLKDYSKATLDAGQYFVILNDGSIVDFLVSKDGAPPGLIPPVECPVLTPAVLSAPTTVPYTGGARQPERWTFYAKQFDKGYVIAGVSEFDNVDRVRTRDLLRRNISLFGSTLESAKRVSPSRVDNGVSFALVGDRGVLINGGGRIPLRTDAMEIGRASERAAQRILGGTDYYVLYSAITDPNGKRVGTAILPQEIKYLSSAIQNLVRFNITIASLSIIVLILLTFFYSRKHEREKQEIRKAFQNYFSPQILDAILREPERLKLGGQRREVTVLFSDIRSFTSITEKLPPQQLTRLLQEYFSEMTDTVFATDGIVDKYIGDAIMAFGGAPIEQPDQADRAVRTAIDMTKRLRKLQEKWAGEGLPVLDIGIGINLGIATVGNFGSARRFDYTVIGDTVNAASRIESLNKEHHSHIIISESTKQQLTVSVQTRDLGEVHVRGKDKPVRIFEVLAE